MSVCICSLARDCAPALRRNLPLLDSMCARFRSAHVVIVENDSKDESKEVLRRWQAGRSQVRLVLNDFGARTLPDAASTTVNPSYSRFRIEQMASHRNRYLDDAATIDGLDYVIVVDLDLYRIELDGIAHAFGQSIPWDAQFANGRISDPYRAHLADFYWDTYAFWEVGDSTPQTEERMASYWEALQPLEKGMPLVAVQSAFCGVGVYRWDAMKGHRYGVEPNSGDSRVEVLSEHVYLHRGMIASGHGRLFINPSMVVYYNEPRWPMSLRAKRLAHVIRHRGIAGAARKLASKMTSRDS